ncbi:transposase, partial [Desertibacillus haloalkaliphilus]|uniref:transposase n=1 Tax=Desertibacillus haloalkaliphilus TaxID=1328930 RepID=UPI001C272F4E
MAKYDDEFKLRIVKAYLSGEGGYRRLAKEWGLPDSKPLRNWVRIYNTVGEKGLERRKTSKSYSGKFKLDVIHYYQTSGESYLDVAIKYNLSNPGIVK